MHCTLMTGLVLTGTFGFGLVGEGINPIFNPMPLNEESSGSGAQVDSGHELEDGKLDGYIESWVYVFIPGAGTYTLREVLEEGSAGWDAFAAYGEPIESYELVSIFTHSVNGNNSGIEVLVPVGGCPGDFNDDGVIDIHDILIFADWFLGGDLRADINGDGLIDLFDQFAFFELMLDGCA